MRAAHDFELACGIHVLNPFQFVLCGLLSGFGGYQRREVRWRIVRPNFVGCFHGAYMHPALFPVNASCIIIFDAVYALAMKRYDLQKLRERLGLSQAEMAEKLGIHQTTVHRIEADGRKPSKPVQKLLEQMATQI